MMGKERDFTAETIEYIKENLTDKDPDVWYDSIQNLFHELFDFNRFLPDVFYSFDAYMY